MYNVQLYDEESVVFEKKPKVQFHSLPTKHMPKVAPPQLPLQGLFGVYKPSGPTSMSILESLKRVFRTSPLFVDPNAPPPAQLGRKAKKAGPVKMGQGGTLDPLADGVLGTFIPFDMTSFRSEKTERWEHEQW